MLPLFAYQNGNHRYSSFVVFLSVLLALRQYCIFNRNLKLSRKQVIRLARLGCHYAWYSQRLDAGCYRWSLCKLAGQRLTKNEKSYGCRIVFIGRFPSAFYRIICNFP